MFKSDITRTHHEAKEHVGMRYTCDVCGYGTAFKHMIQKHQQTHQEDKGRICCQDCGAMISPSYMKTHYETKHLGESQLT